MGHQADADELIARAQPGPLGTPIQQLLDMADELGAPAMAIQSEPSRLTQLPIPSILIVDKGSHCVVYDEVDERAATATIFEPESNRRQVVTLERLQRAWTGEAIVFDAPYPSRLAFSALSALIALVIASPAAYLAFRPRPATNGDA